VACADSKVPLEDGSNDDGSTCTAQIALLSNTGEPSGQEQAHGLELARDEINATGGISGCRVKLIFKNDNNSPAISQKQAQELVAAGDVLAIFGTNSTSSTMAALSVTEKAHMPFIVPSVSGGLITTVGHRWVFRLAAPDYSLVSALFEFIAMQPTTVGLRSVAIIFPQSVSSQSMFIAAQNAARERGIALVAAEEYPYGTRDFGAYLARLKVVNPDIIFLDAISQKSDDALALMDQAQALELNPKLYVAVAGPFVEPSFAKRGEHVIVGAQWTAGVPWRDGQGQVAASFHTKYSQRFRTAPGARAVASYTGLFVLRRALEQAAAGSPIDWSKLASVRQLARAGLQKIDLTDTLFGPVRFDQNGQNAHPALIVQIQGGEQVLVYPGQLKTREVVVPSPSWKGAP
jgi:branched-chain amino acid transport system substrate-binding protein